MDTIKYSNRIYFTLWLLLFSMLLDISITSIHKSFNLFANDEKGGVEQLFNIEKGGSWSSQIGINEIFNCLAEAMSEETDSKEDFQLKLTAEALSTDSFLLLIGSFDNSESKDLFFSKHCLPRYIYFCTLLLLD